MKGKADLNILDDEELIGEHLAIQRREVFSILYDRYHPLIQLKCRSILKEEHLAKDLTHDIFITIFTKIDQFAGRSKFSLWVHTISVNTCLAFLRKKKKIEIEFTATSESEAHTEQFQQEDSQIEEVKAQELDVLMRQLGPDQRILLIMKYVDGLTIKEMSKILNTGESAIKMRLHRIKEEMVTLYQSNIDRD